MARIVCAECDAPFCDGCNINNLYMMLRNGKFDGIMDEHHTIDPAADVKPVVHGRWFLDGDYEYINCSACLYPFYMGFECSSDAQEYLARDDKWRYCPNCGALMDKDGDGE